MSERQKQMADEFIERKKHKKHFYLGGPGFLQTFAGGGDDDLDDDDDSDDDDDDGPGDDADDDNDDDDDDDDGPGDSGIEYSKGTIDQIMGDNKLDFGQILKDNPKLKKEYQTRFNKNMSKRMAKFEGVDIEEYNDLKARAKDGKLEGDAKTWKDKHDALKVEVEQSSKKTAIQQSAIESGLDAEQIAFVSSTIKMKSIEKDDEGDWMGIEDELERIQEKFPRMFPSDADDDDDNADDKKKKGKKKYNPGDKKHNQNSKGDNPKDSGRQRALDRHKKKEK